MKLHYSSVSNNILKVKQCKRLDVHLWGVDNAFPSMVEALIDMSVTAKGCVDKVAKAIYGDSFGEIGDVVVNSSGQSLNEVLRVASREYAKHNNVFLSIGYNANNNVKSISVLPCTDVRLYKADDKEYIGKFVVYANWDKEQGKQDDSKFVYVDRYTSNLKALQDQIAKVDGVTNFRGHILHIKKDSLYQYALSDMSSVLEDALTESNSQKFRSNGSTDGFLNAKVLVVPPFADADEKRLFFKSLDDVRGSENSSGVVVLELSSLTDDVAKSYSMSDLAGEYNDKIFEYSDNICERNICKAFGVPIMLINPSDNSLFGNSGEVLKEAKKQLWEARAEERNQLQSAFSELMQRFEGKELASLEILNPYISDDELEEDAKGVNKKAQASLRGSVGGVSSLLDICKSVKDGTVTQDSAVAIIVAVFGYSAKRAKEMIGYVEPIDLDDETNNNS